MLSLSALFAWIAPRPLPEAAPGCHCERGMSLWVRDVTVSKEMSLWARGCHCGRGDVTCVRRAPSRGQAELVQAGSPCVWWKRQRASPGQGDAGVAALPARQTPPGHRAKLEEGPGPARAYSKRKNKNKNRNLAYIESWSVYKLENRKLGWNFEQFDLVEGVPAGHWS